MSPPSDATLASITACPSCGADLDLPDGPQAACASCGARFARLAFAWDLTPPRERWSEGLWTAWEQLQANGVASYEADASNNLGVGDRADFLDFSRFCGLDGRVLDVGCGPQAWPTHFETHAPGTEFFGVDPLVGQREPRYTQVRALAEFLPFRDETFDHIVFATTLDHFVDPVAALREARRVVRPDGTIELWVGHKSADAPVPSQSPDWYSGLERPAGTDDVFHIKRLDGAEAVALFARAGLDLAEHEEHAIDPYRTNFFFRLRPQ